MPPHSRPLALVFSLLELSFLSVPVLLQLDKLFFFVGGSKYGKSTLLGLVQIISVILTVLLYTISSSSSICCIMIDAVVCNVVQLGSSSIDCCRSK